MPGHDPTNKMAKHLLERITQEVGDILYVAEKWQKQNELPDAGNTRPKRHSQRVHVVDVISGAGVAKGISPMPDEDREPYELQPETYKGLFVGCVIFTVSLIGAGIFGMVMHWIFYGQ